MRNVSDGRDAERIESNTYMFSGPKQDKALQQRCTRPGSTCKQVDIAFRCGLWKFGLDLQTIFTGSSIEEAHLTPNVVECADQQVKCAESRVLHGNGSVWETHLANQSSNETDKLSRDVGVLGKPLRQGSTGYCSTASVREERLLRCSVDTIGITGEKMVRK